MRESEQDHSGPCSPLADRDFSSHDACALHGHVLHRPLAQPVRQRQQIRRHRPEGPNRLRGHAGRARHDHAGNDPLLMDVQPTAPLVDDFPRRTPASGSDRRSRASGVRGVCSTCCPRGRNNSGCRGTPRSKCPTGSTHQSQSDLAALRRSAPGYQAAPRDFHPSGCCTQHEEVSSNTVVSQGLPTGIPGFVRDSDGDRGVAQSVCDAR